MSVFPASLEDARGTTKHLEKDAVQLRSLTLAWCEIGLMFPPEHHWRLAMSSWDWDRLRKLRELGVITTAQRAGHSLHPETKLMQRSFTLLAKVVSTRMNDWKKVYPPAC